MINDSFIIFLIVVNIIMLQIVLAAIGYYVHSEWKNKKWPSKSSKYQVDEILDKASDTGVYKPSADVKKQMNRNSWY